MTTADPTALSATRAARAIRDGDLTSEDLVSACLERIAEREPEVHAWQQLDAAEALRQARACDTAVPVGPLHGVPVGVKDLIDTADRPTTYGSSIYAGHHPSQDAACVRRLRDGGAVLLGKTVTTEFALFHPGPTANPHDRMRTPGGSSSGSAAAVADGMVPLALGTQTAASVVRPASYCGVFGLKPTFGAVPTDGVKPISPSLDTVGVFAHDADDLALALAVMCGRPLDDDHSEDPPRMALARTAQWQQAEPTTRERLGAVASALGAPEVALPASFDALVGAQTTIMLAEAARHLDREQRAHGERLSHTLRSLLASGAAIDDATVRRAVDHADRCRALLPEVFADHDVLLTPSVVGEAPIGLAATGDPLFGRMWTLLGTPTVAVPGLSGPAGLPLGVQVVGAPGADATVIAAARWLADRL